MGDGEYRNWAELPEELTSSILHRLGALEILENAQKVCRSWRRLCKDPSMWRVIDMDMPMYLLDTNYNLDIMYYHAIDRSQGGLVEIDLRHIGTDDLLNYIADRSSSLKILTLRRSYEISDEGFAEAVVKLPLLEHLEMSGCSLSGNSLKVLGKSCPNMKTLKINKCPQKVYDEEGEAIVEKYDDDALAIAETFPGLHHLQLCGNGLSDTGLKSILDNCPNLEHLDIRRCFSVSLVGDLQKLCSERVKVVRYPNDSTKDDYPFDLTYNYMDSSEWSYGSSSMDYTPDDEYDDKYFCCSEYL